MVVICGILPDSVLADIGEILSEMNLGSMDRMGGERTAIDTRDVDRVAIATAHALLRSSTA